MTLIWKCSEDGLEPQFKQAVIDLLTPSEFHWNIMYGYRTIELQTKLYEAHLKGGPLAAPPGKSPHNYGLAVDVQLIVNGDAEWSTDHPGWQWLFAAILPTPRLHSGRSFGDSDHIERVHWKAYRDWANEPLKQVDA